MKNKTFAFIMIMLCAMMFFACADNSQNQAASPSAEQENSQPSESQDSAFSQPTPPDSAQSPSASASDGQNGGSDEIKESVEIDASLLEPDFALQDFSDIADMSNYLFYYINPNSNDASVVMTKAAHYDDRSDSLQKELEKNVDNYISTVKASMFKAETTEAEYFEIDGYPACVFDVVGELNDGGTTYRARTLLIAGEKYVYCLQLQDSEENFRDSEPLFESVIESVKISN